MEAQRGGADESAVADKRKLFYFGEQSEFAGVECDYEVCERINPTQVEDRENERGLV